MNGDLANWMVPGVRVKGGLADIDALSRQYTGEPYPVRDRPRVSALIKVDRVHAWGAQKNNSQSSGR